MFWEALEERLLLSRWTYVVGRTFAGTGRREAVELLGVQHRVYLGCTFEGGTTDFRANGCRFLSFVDCTFRAMRGPADPDGSGLQLIDCGDVYVGRCHFEASPFASDLLSVYGDRRVRGAVVVEDSDFHGAGVADFSTSICLDGVSPPDLVLRRDSIDGARCGVTVAAGRATIVDMKLTGCVTDVYVAGLYGTNATLTTDDGSAVLLGKRGTVGGIA